MTVQRKNAQLISLLESYFLRVDSTALALQTVSSLMSMLPGCVEVWPGSSPGANGGYHGINKGLLLDPNNTPQFGVLSNKLVSYVDYGINDWHYGNDTNFDISIDESHISPSNQGMTIISWFHPTASSSLEEIAGKTASSLASSSSGYYLLKTLSDEAQFGVTNGTTQHTSPTIPLNVDEWNFCAGTISRGNEIGVYVNGQYNSNPTTVTTINVSSTTDFAIGASQSGSRSMQGKVAIVGLYKTHIPENFLSMVYHLTRRWIGI